MMASRLLLPDSVMATLESLFAGLRDGRSVRTVNFHATPRYRAEELRRQIELYSKLFMPITEDNFGDAVTGHWRGARPGLMPVLFEGFRDQYDVLLPILEEFGFVGWFFVPSAFLNVRGDEQRAFAAAHSLHFAEHDEYPGQRVALSWDEARDICRRGHMFACHSRTHNEVRPDTPFEILEDEIVNAKAEMERELKREIDIFCWLRGASVGVNPQADDLLRRAGFRYLFSNFKIERLG
jgi:peptidoglycan/xylan/chitin deacetylase (PgdA/CDA1 family)